MNDQGQTTNDASYPLMRYDEAGRYVGNGTVHNAPLPIAEESETFRRFTASMAMNYQRWHDGVGYDLALLAQMSVEDRRQVESLLLARGVNDWRDVEALIALDSETARAALAVAAERGNPSVCLALMKRAPALIDQDAQSASVAERLENASWADDLSDAIDLAADLPTAPVIEALWRGLERRDGDVAVHFAALLAYLHGLAQQPFDLAMRPFFLTFNTENSAERLLAIRQLCRLIEEASV